MEADLVLRSLLVEGKTAKRTPADMIMRRQTPAAEVAGKILEYLSRSKDGNVKLSGQD